MVAERTPADRRARSDAEAIASIREAWRTLLTGGDVDAADPGIAAAIGRLDTAVDGNVARLDRSAAGRLVFTDLPLTGRDREASSHVRDTFHRLERMATAFRTPASRHAGDTALLADVLAGLEITNAEIYNDTQARFGNWFHLEISGPHALGNICVLLHEHLPAEALALYIAAIDHFVPVPKRTAANRVNMCHTVLVRGLLDDNTERIRTACDELGPALRYVTSGDGFHRDGSFLQHDTVAYTGAYGLEVMGGVDNIGLARLLPLLAGTPWELPDAYRRFVLDIVDSVYVPMVYAGQMLDLARGRAISRHFQRGHDRGRLVAESMLRLAVVADPDRARRWRSLCKGWLTRQRYADGPVDDRTVAQVALFGELLSDTSIPAAPEPTGHTVFPGMARSVHRRPGWAFAVAMANTRICYYESINRENLQGWHTGDGMTYLYDADDRHYSDDFWPTIDPYRLPGTTVDTAPLPATQQDRPVPVAATWAGGAVAAGELAAIGMDLEAWQSPLRAKKSWMCLDDDVVALGAGITGSGPDHPVETIVENRNLGVDGGHTLTIGGVVRAATPNRTYVGTAEWAHLDGVGGYVFPGGADVRALREARTGAWADVTQYYGQAPTNPITRRYVTLWFDHGTEPEDADYAYLVLPGATSEETARRTQDPRLDIIANTAEAQAVRDLRRGAILANLWTPGSVLDITVDAPCSLIVLEPQDATEPTRVAVADPTHETSRVTVEVRRSGFGSYAADAATVVTSLDPVLFTVDMSNSFGATHTVMLYPG